MGEAKVKKSYFKGLKAEFKKIIWPDKASVGRQTTAVLIISVLLGVLIKILDIFIQYGVDFIAK
ncbi:MAG: preprotein translocase subunit SecE [Lachnospiraceae bacterium]|nr:preprotein translocase subunit SecE [Lachnospiraceae bacterium]MBQ4068867.1 preprotein translocase subunit SecE [Lachnospiraceae bacterium]